LNFLRYLQNFNYEMTIILLTNKNQKS
jgi:hypothetical protein